MDEFLEGPIDGDDLFPCKGCGEILEEGKAFELAGNRWHLDCFRCNTCNTLLDSDANLLLLGDGSLICNNCTYSCSACGNKIEDLAILTGDQAFCSTCFRCRNCKRKIENLRYARTSQGIFCMNCHESLMARRRKKSKAAAQPKARDKESSPMVKEKSLPALPPSAIPPNAFSDELVNPELDAPTELSPRPRAAYSRTEPRPPRSPERHQDSSRHAGLAPPSAGYRKNRNSTLISGDVGNGDADGFFIPVALDPSPVLSASTPRSASDHSADAGRKTRDNKEYFSLPKSSVPPDKKADSQASTPHIAFQEKSRQASSDHESLQSEKPVGKASKGSGQQQTSPVPNSERKPPNDGTQATADDQFKLQDVPKSRKSLSTRSKTHSLTDAESSASGKTGNGISCKEKQQPTMSPKSDSTPVLSSPDKAATPQSSQDSRSRDEDGVRPSLDSLSSNRSDLPSWKAAPRKDLSSRSANGKPVASHPPRPATAGDVTSPSARPAPPEHKLSDAYMQPRAPPQPPNHTQKESVSSAPEPHPPKESPKLPRWSSGGDFSLDEDMARILGTDEGSSSIMRRVSNVVRHGRNNSTESGHTHPRIGHSRSVSETTRATLSPRWPKTPIAEDPTSGGHHHEISSPISLSGGIENDPAFLKRRLRNSELRVAELERQFSTELDLRDLNKKLVEKRKTVSVLDTQTEVMIRQLEVLSGYVERAKETKQPVDARELEDSAVKEFVQKLEKVKQDMSAAIEELAGERDELLEEKNQAVADRDRALVEFEQLSSKNAQLADMNNDLTHQIQERFKSQIGGSELRSPGGLGIYSHKGASSASIHLDATSLQTGSTLIGGDVDESVVEGPTVVNIRKGQVRKFNWKKGSSKMAHGITKGINRAAGAFQQQEQQRLHMGSIGDSIGLPYNMTVAHAEPAMAQTANGVSAQSRAASENAAKGFGFFGGGKKPVKLAVAANSSTPVIAEAPTTLFGSDLVERADYERRQIPSVVTRCIEEVELRGMDMEGIYRKTGGNSQVKMIQEGFDKSEDFDISDPDIDITAVTSALKQYFRKLPVPLLTFDVYERILESNSIQDETERCLHLNKTIGMLPQKHRDCLEFLMFHLARVAGRERENLMSPKNLAVVFAPTIMRDHSLEKEMTDMHAKNLAVQFIIEHSHSIFSESE